MVYQGSKDKLSKYISPIIHDYIKKYGITDYYELFVGGANMIDKIECENRYGYDFNSWLITLLRYAQVDNDLSIAPAECTFEHYKDVRDCYNKRNNKYTNEYISLIGYMASYGGRFFDGGYGRDDKCGKSIYPKRLANLKKQAPLLNGIDFKCQSYDVINPADYHNCLFYLDPPYKNTKKYVKQSIDYDKFYDLCKRLAKDNIVLISEYNMPNDFECLWEKERKVLQISDRTQGIVATERLYKAVGNK